VEQTNLKLLTQYVHAIGKKLALGDATEHTHRSALETLVESLASGITATNEPKHIECGAPDFILRKGSVVVGYIEAKDVDKSLDEAEKTDQLKRYRNSLTNLVLTDYLEFRWYVDSECRLKARLGSPTKDGRIKRDKKGIEDVAELFDNFLSHKAEGVGTPRELAQRMARQAHLIRNLIINAFQNEPEGGSLHTQLAAFRDNLIPDLSPEYFADMYAQTIAYGLFAARCTSKDGASFTRLDAAQNLPKTNPFLRKLFQYIAGYDLDDRIAWLVDDLAQVLAQANMEAVLKDFGKHSGKEDPVVHFYETFLKEYDEKIREMRGVYYTPEAVVSYIVRSIDHLLKTRFNKPQGLADDKTLILDPAVGTATFLYMVINEIYQANTSKGQQGLWNNYVAEKLLPRTFGFELLMAPYAVAHLKLGLLLQETGYEFQSDQRLGIYLTNTLEEAVKRAETLFARWITEEANAAAEIKKDKPIMVVLGNPPYSVSSANKGEFIEKLMERYKTAVRSERNIEPLSDDYIKFIRFAQDRIELTGHGIVGMITNHAYLSGLIHRGMREELLKTFDEIYILNLHGNAMMGETMPDGSPDKNVFDIRQGVAISLFVRRPVQSETKVYYADLWGTREEKYHSLLEADIASMNYLEIKPCSPYYFFIPREVESEQEYNQYKCITDIFSVYSSGIKTHRDHFVIDFEKAKLLDRIEGFRDLKVSDSDIVDKYGLTDTHQWEMPKARKSLSSDRYWQKYIENYLYRPFDLRYIYYASALIERPRTDIAHHMLVSRNVALIAMRQVAFNEPYSHFFVSPDIVDNRAFYSNRGILCLFPLYLYPAENEMQFEGGSRRPNLNPDFIKAVSDKLGLTFIEDGKGDLEQIFGPEDIFNYAYAVFHSPTYRTRYAEFLKIDFPRLPLTSDKELFKALTEKGAELVSMHLMESPTLNNLITKYPIAGSNKVEKVTYNDNDQRVYINKTQYFEGVLPEVWEFHIGGYQVCQKWLKDRKGRTLTYDELTHYQKVIVALKETNRLMAEIDGLIPGWPVE
jgi:predicted helicase